MQVTLNQILDRLREFAQEELKPAMEYSDIAPPDAHHRSAMFIRLPYPTVAAEQGEVFERLSRLVESINRPDTIKVDVYTVIGDAVLQGFQPHTDLTAKGHFDPESIVNFSEAPYVLQILVDVIQPDALKKTLNALKE